MAKDTITAAASSDGHNHSYFQLQKALAAVRARLTRAYNELTAEVQTGGLLVKYQSAAQAPSC